MPYDSPLPAARLFDEIGIDYEHAFGALPEQHAALAWLCERLPPRAHVLDVGCGTGIPTAYVLTDNGFHVEGIDVSSIMIDIARRQVPGATFHQADVREYSTEPASLDAVCAFFSLLQMTRAEIDASIARMAGWLRPGGYLVLATVPADVEQIDIVFMGYPAQVTSYAASDFLDILRRADLEVLDTRESTFVPDHDNAQPEPHLFVHCRRPDRG